MFLLYKTQKRHHSFSENIQSNVLFKALITNASPCGYFHAISGKAPSLFTICQKNNCYRSTTSLFGLGQTIVIESDLMTDDSSTVHDTKSKPGQIRSNISKPYFEEAVQSYNPGGGTHDIFGRGCATIKSLY